MLSNTVVASNTLPTGAWAAGGGGIFVGGSTLTLVNSRVERHLAPASSNGTGAGIYASDSLVTLDNSQVLSNTAGVNGGGLMLYGTSTLNVLNGSIIRSNESLNAEGGGIALERRRRGEIVGPAQTGCCGDQVTADITASEMFVDLLFALSVKPPLEVADNQIFVGTTHASRLSPRPLCGCNYSSVAVVFFGVSD